MSSNMRKLILAFCMSVTATGAVGCGGEPADALAGDEAAAVQSEAAAGGAGGEDIELKESNLTTPTRYIDYGALRGNRAPCASNQVLDRLYNRCVPRPAPIYRRGCTQQTRCARG